MNEMDSNLTPSSKISLKRGADFKTDRLASFEGGDAKTRDLSKIQDGFFSRNMRCLLVPQRLSLTLWILAQRNDTENPRRCWQKIKNKNG